MPQTSQHNQTPGQLLGFVTSAMRDLVPYMYVGWEILVVVLFFGGVGYLLDKWLTTSPWLFIAFLLAGVGAAILLVLRITRTREPR